MEAVEFEGVGEAISHLFRCWDDARHVDFNKIGPFASPLPEDSQPEPTQTRDQQQYSH